MRVLNKCFLLILLSALLIGQGCKSPLAKSAWAEPTWGEPVEGLQCRLRPDKRIWRLTETPTFKFDMRNRGKRIFVFWPAQKLELCQIEFDRNWYHWPSPVIIDSPLWPLGPGARYSGVAIELHKQFKINLTPGRHIVRVAFSPEGVRVVSNPVGIKILPAD